jgi:putative tryptophan/tyrosine transport system substrate-binding protein
MNAATFARRDRPPSAADRQDPARRARAALQPRRQRADALARDRRLEENRRCAEPAHDGSVTVVRTALTVVLALTLLAAPLAAEGQQAGKVYRIGYLTVPSRETAGAVANIFQVALRDLGWIAGRNVVIDYRFADSNLGRLPDLAAELVRLRADVIVAGANAAVMAVKNATRTIPIVMFLAVDPVGAGLVASMARPGGNVTGLTATAGPELYSKQLQLLKNAFPRVSRVEILVNQKSAYDASALPEIETATRALGLQWQVIEVRDPGDFDKAFAAFTTARSDAIFVTADSLFYQHRARLAHLAAKSRLPAMWGLAAQAEAGGLMAYGTDLDDLARRAATFVDKILKGAKPADLPVEQPTKFELVINMKTAKALRLTISPSVLLSADRVIE